MQNLTEKLVRSELLALLGSENAHMSFDEVVADFPMELINEKTDSIPYSPWHMIEHMRLAQWDILEFIRNPDHVSPDFPTGFHPRADLMADPRMWSESLQRFRDDLEALKSMAADPESDLTGPLPHAPAYTLFRQLLVAADHNAYHAGELALYRQSLGAWPKKHQYLTGTGRAEYKRK